MEVPGYDLNDSRSLVKLPLSFRSTTADASVTGVDGDVGIETATGDIEGRRIGGNLEVQTATGEILVVDAAQDVDVTTATAEIQVIQVKGDLDVRSATGWVHITDPGGDVTVRTASPVAGDWFIEARTGSIDVSFPREGSNVSVSARTNVGSLSTNLGFSISTSVNLKTVSGKLGTGEHRIDLEASSGSITIQGTGGGG